MYHRDNLLSDEALANHSLLRHACIL